MARPRFSTLALIALLAVAALLVGKWWVLLGRTSVIRLGERTVVTVRLWTSRWPPPIGSPSPVQPRTPHIEVRTTPASYASYFDTLGPCRPRRRRRHSGNQQLPLCLIRRQRPAYARSPPSGSDWEPSVVGQFTRGGVLWGVPQLTDAGIAMYYNAGLLDAAGVNDTAAGLLPRWDPDPAKDTLRPMLARLTVDAAGRTAGTPGFDPRRVRQWGYNAANDLQGINLNYIGSAGGVFSEGDRFAFDSPQAAAGLGYVVDLINTAHVSPPASDTNNNGEFSRNQFLSGRMAVFQSGTYNLARLPGRPGSAGGW